MTEQEKRRELERFTLSLEYVVEILALTALMVCVLMAAYVDLGDMWRVLLILGGVAIFIFGTVYALKIEQLVGYYQCAKCKHRYVPTFSSVLWAMHIGRTRFMECPKCKEDSWQRKVLDDEIECKCGGKH